jgi:hypothetical protein
MSFTVASTYSLVGFYSEKFPSGRVDSSELTDGKSAAVSGGDARTESVIGKVAGPFMVRQSGARLRVRRSRVK